MGLRPVGLVVFGAWLGVNPDGRVHDRQVDCSVSFVHFPRKGSLAMQGFDSYVANRGFLGRVRLANPEDCANVGDFSPLGEVVKPDFDSHLVPPGCCTRPRV